MVFDIVGSFSDDRNRFGFIIGRLDVFRFDFFCINSVSLDAVIGFNVKIIFGFI